MERKIAEEMGDHFFETADNNPIKCRHCDRSFAEHLRAAVIRDGIGE